MNTYEEELATLRAWTRQKADEYAAEESKEIKSGLYGRDTPAGRKLTSLNREYVLKVRELKKKYHIEK